MIKITDKEIISAATQFKSSLVLMLESIQCKDEQYFELAKTSMQRNEMEADGKIMELILQLNEVLMNFYKNNQ